MNEQHSNFANTGVPEIDFVNIGIMILLGLVSYWILAKNISFEKLNPFMMGITFLLMGHIIYSMYQAGNFGISGIMSIHWLILGFVLPHLDKRHKNKS